MESGLSHRVLVLNRLWQAVNIIGAKRAVSLMFQGHAQVLHSEDGDFRVYSPEDWVCFSQEHPPRPNQAAIKSVSLVLRVPSVLLLKSYDRVPGKEVRFSRQNLFERDGYRCQYCGTIFEDHELNMDHVIPRHHGGKTSWENIVTSCIPCNSRKANRLPHEAGMRLQRPPHRPRWRSFVSTIKHVQHEEGWSYFLQGK